MVGKLVKWWFDRRSWGFAWYWSPGRNPKAAYSRAGRNWCLQIGNHMWQSKL